MQTALVEALVQQMPGFAVAAAANAGLEALVKTLTLEIAPLRLYIVRSGPTDTPWFRAAIGGSDEQIAAAGAGTPIGRLNTPARLPPPSCTP